MTNEQLLKILQYQQNRLINLKYNVVLSIHHYSHDEGMFYRFAIFKERKFIFNESYIPRDSYLTTKLEKLIQFVDELLNKK